MKTKLLLSALFTFVFCLLSSQVPQGFNYQAIARDGSGNPILNTSLPVTITIQSDSLGGTIFWKELHSSVATNGFGMFNLIIGKGAKQLGSAVAAFNDINWTVTPKFIKTEILYQSELKNMGSSRLWAVPYSMVAGELVGSLDKLEVAGKTTSFEEALFEVKNKDGQTVFAVYNEGVRIYVDNGAKTAKGGFAIGGFGTTKAPSQEYFVVNADSIRAYIFDNPLVKTAKGGFAIGGFGTTKGFTNDYLLISPDSARIYVDNAPSTKGKKGGFAIGGFDMTKATPTITPFTSLTHVNYFIGQKSGIKNTTGIHNSFIGYETGINNTSGRKNVFLGYHAGYSNDTASYNVFIGNESGNTNRFGRYNTFIGYQSGWNNFIADNSVFLGYKAGYSNNAANNVFLGVESGYSNAIGSQNDFIGYQTGLSNTSGQSNIFIGTQAGFTNTTSSYNVFLGHQAGYTSNAGYNSFIGYQAGRSNTSGQYNSFMGYNAGLSNTSGASNVFLGTSSGYSNTTGSYNTFFGYQAGYSNNGDWNFFSGTQAGYKNTIGNYNSFIGFYAGFNNTTGSSNVFIGERAGYSNLTGNYNTIIGESAGRSQETGYSNVFIGPECGYSNIGGQYNTFLGGWTGYENKGSSNVMIGSLSGNMNINGSGNTFLGRDAGRSNTGSQNVFLGLSAGSNESGSGKLYIENSSTATPLIWGDFSLNQLVINGNSSNNPIGRTFYVNGTAGGNFSWNVDSDARMKKNINSITDPLQKVKRLRGVNFEWGDTSRSELGVQMGFIAQEAINIVPEVVTYKNDHYSMQYAPVTALLVEAMKEQQKQIETQQKEIDELKTLVNSLIANQPMEGN
jgi:Chaperone of endosialidase